MERGKQAATELFQLTVPVRSAFKSDRQATSPILVTLCSQLAFSPSLDRLVGPREQQPVKPLSFPTEVENGGAQPSVGACTYIPSSQEAETRKLPQIQNCLGNK